MGYCDEWPNPAELDIGWSDGNSFGYLAIWCDFCNKRVSGLTQLRAKSHQCDGRRRLSALYGSVAALNKRLRTRYGIIKRLSDNAGTAIPHGCRPQQRFSPGLISRLNLPAVPLTRSSYFQLLPCSLRQRRPRQEFIAAESYVPTNAGVSSQPMCARLFAPGIHELLRQQGEQCGATIKASFAPSRISRCDSHSLLAFPRR